MKSLVLFMSLVTALPLHAGQPKSAASSKLQRHQEHQSLQQSVTRPDIERLKVQLQAIRNSSMSDDRKSQMLRRLSDREEVELQAEMHAVDAATLKDKSAPAQERRKAAMDNIQKLLDLVHSMNPPL